MTGPDGKTRTVNWDETLFWNVYYVKGAFLDADKAYEVINGMRTLELRMLAKCITTTVLARALAAHPAINVNCSAVPGHPNARLREANMFLGLPAPLFTIDFEPKPRPEALPRAAFKAFFDLPGAGIWPAGKPRPDQHRCALPGPDQPFRNVRRGPWRGWHFPHDHSHRRRQ